VSLPGGRHGHGDASMLATAIRETREELDIDLAATRLIGQLPVVHPLSSGKQGIEVTPFAFAAVGAVTPKLSAEAAAVFWLPMSVAASGALDGTYLYEPANIAFPCWTYEGHTIWGLTHRILSSLLEG
jgi:8-oxo-dGTP pyrophosphatase MutT (NUDIX family)